MCKHGTKTTLVFLPADGEAYWSLLPSSVSLLSGGTVQSENTYSCILKVTCIDLILTNMPRSFQSICVIETGLSEFHLMTLIVMEKKFKKIKPRIIYYR